MPLLLEACPSFKEQWAAYRAYLGDDEPLLEVDLEEFGRHVVDLLKRGNADEFPAVFDVIERLHLEGSAPVQEAATAGLLESIQSAARDRLIDLERFAPYLQPETKAWWDGLLEFWAKGGESADDSA